MNPAPDTLTEDVIVVKPVATVGDLIAVLRRLPPDTPVVQARDDEGNGFLLLAGISVGRYLPGTDELDSIDAPAPAAPSHNVVCLWPASHYAHTQRLAIII